jgi:hypothetical protein
VSWTEDGHEVQAELTEESHPLDRAAKDDHAA